MNELQTTKIFNAIAPGVIRDDAAFPSFVIDKADLDGADYLEFIVSLGATDIAMAQLKVMESDVRTDSTTLGGSPSPVKEATTKPGADDDNKVAVFGVDLRKSRKRFLQLQATAGNGSTGTYLSAIAVARRPVEASSDAARRNLLFAEYV